MKEKIGLVLEGGGFRGLYTEGILENFLDKGVHLPYVIGVSMGTVVGSSYISRQKRRNYDIAMTYVDDARYISFRNIFTQGGLFGMDFIFNELANELIPFDYKTFGSSDQELAIGAMNCADGSTDYFYKSKLPTDDLLLAMRASCSLPFISRMIPIADKNYLDGGVSDSIPYKKALEDGCDKIIVILTRDADYIREPFNGNRVGNLVYRDYPAVIETMEERHITYHQTLKELEALEKEGKALIIRPPKPIELSRVERDRAKLRATYMMGYNQGRELMDTVDEFINGHKKKQHQIQLSYETIAVENIEEVQPLWEKLNEIHSILSPDFGERYAGTTFGDRVRKFTKIDQDRLRIMVVRDQRKAIGYCISTIDPDAGVGDLESIYLDQSYRKKGIGETLMEDAKSWMQDKGCERMVLGVSVGNEDVIPFYKKAGFYPRLIELEYKA